MDTSVTSSLSTAASGREGEVWTSSFNLIICNDSLSHKQLELLLHLLGSELPQKQEEISVGDLKREIVVWKSVNVGSVRRFSSLFQICVFRETPADCQTLSLS